MSEIPLWQVTLFTNDIEEFSFSYIGEQRILIKGRKTGGEWFVDAKVESLLFSFGCNNKQTKIKTSVEIICRYLVLTVNYISEYSAPGRHKLLCIIKNLRGL